MCKMQSRGGKASSADLTWSPTDFSFGWVAAKWALMEVMHALALS
jgi:hypothetical protein